MKSYFEALGEVIPETMIASKDGLSYLSAARAMQLAGLPQVEFVDFDGTPYLPILGGALVAVDITLQGSEIKQRTWLPVMDQDNRCIRWEKTSASDINNSRQRCLVKAIATVLGTGMSVFLGTNGDGQKAIKLLGLSPDSDLSAAEPVLDKLSGGEPYLGWNFALAAVRIVDPGFTWAVAMWEGRPYREVLGGVFIDIDTNYKGKTQRFSLPVMDETFSIIPIEKTNVWLWNRTVMRALSKAIAFTSGYGLKVYAEDFGKVVDIVEKQEQASVQAEAPKPALVVGSSAESISDRKAPAQAEQSRQAAGKPDTIARIKDVIQKRYDKAQVPGLLTLFEAIKKSDKYTADEKPVCQLVLLKALSTLPEDASADPLVFFTVLAEHQAVAFADDGIRERIRAKLTAFGLRKAFAREPKVLSYMLDLFTNAGVVRGDTEEEREQDLIRLALQGGISEDVLQQKLEGITWVKASLLQEKLAA